MRVSFCLLFTTMLALLGASCQRAAYSFRIVNERNPVLTSPTGSASPLNVVEEPVVVPPTDISPALVKRRSRQLPSRTLHVSSGRCSSPLQSRPRFQPRTSISPYSTVRLVSQPQRTPSLSENAKFISIFIAGTLLLLAAGLFLTFGVGGWLAVTGGVVLLLAGLAASLFTLYIATYKHGR